MSPSSWGPPTWIFMHTLAAKVKESSFSSVGQGLINVIVQICNNLPCPECAQHAKEFWRKVKIANISTKSDLINLLFVFHNLVNKRKKLPPFNYANINYYDTKSVVESYNLFARNFNTHGNMNLITESFHRNMMLTSLKTWLMTNINHFER